MLPAAAGTRHRPEEGPPAPQKVGLPAAAPQKLSEVLFFTSSITA